MELFRRLFGSRIKTQNPRVKTQVSNEAPEKAQEIRERKIPGEGELINYFDRPYSLMEPDDEYTAFGDLRHEVTIKERGIASASKDKPSDFYVRLNSVLDLTNPAQLKHFGETIESICRQPYEFHNMIGHIARRKGFEGILSPSPRVPGGKVLIKFASPKG
jgi:hypothetical protein